MRIRNVLLLATVLAFCQNPIAAREEAENDEFVDWLNKPAELQPTASQARTLLICQGKQVASLDASSDQDKYAVMVVTQSDQIIQIRHLVNGESNTVFHLSGTMVNNFAVKGLLWSPDGDQLFAKFGFSDMPKGFWFAIWPKMETDPTNGISLGKLELMDISERPDYLSSPRGPNSEPVWTEGGKRFESERQAELAGFGNRLRITSGECSEAFGGIFLKCENKAYRMLVSTINGPELFIFAGDTFRGKVSLAAIPIGRAIFRYIDGDLTLKLAWWESKGIGKLDKSERFQWKDSTFRRSFSFGKKRLLSAKAIGPARILVQLQQADVHEWLLLDTDQLYH